MKIRRIIALNLFLVGMSAEVLEIKKVKDLIFYHASFRRDSSLTFNKSDMKRRFLLQAYGGDNFHRMAYLSAFSLLNAGVPAESLIFFTDAKDKFSFGCQNIEATRHCIRAWQGDLFFPHRLKIKLLQATAERFPDTEITYIDADTFASAVPPSVGEQGKRVLFDRKDTAFPPDWLELYRKGCGIQSEMWIAGVIGLAAKDILAVCEVALKVCDRLSLLYPKKIEYVEQYGFSAACASFEKLSADHSLIHYWNRSREVEKIISKFSYTELEKITPKRFEEICIEADALRHSIFHRLRLRIKGLQRSFYKRKREMIAMKKRQTSRY